ncbi:4-hydroxybenzoate polyprenyltransferase [Cyanobium sp. FGCU-6]|jgi:4-hydroxybenzoate polyprenyltransferase|nr:4-hydroxybenzoate polyprenyltransferase [Cyanobium sp. FGCU6]
MAELGSWRQTGGFSSIGDALRLLRWHKPSGRLILLIPAGWGLWLAPGAPPPAPLVGWIVLGGLAVSGAGCIANDLWDRRIDPLVERTRDRPLAAGRVAVGSAVALLLICLLAALAVVLALPSPVRGVCLGLAVATLPPVLLYPSAKRWFPLPQLVLAFCWGFAVLIPWAASGGFEPGPGRGLAGGAGGPLLLTWLAAVVWTFGFDTVYAMSDRDDDRRLGVRSSALTLGAAAPAVVSLCYGGAALALAVAAVLQGLGGPLFWIPWAVAAAGMQREAALLRRSDLPRSAYGRHFARQVQLGALLLLALVLPTVAR